MTEPDVVGQQPGRAVPRFRLWPPVAIALPWLLGFFWSLNRGSDDFATVWILLGWVLIVAFVLWNGWCLWLFRRHRTGLLPGQQTSDLIRSGPYRHSRNPLYLGLLALYVGSGLVVSSVPVLVLTPVAFAALHWGAVLPEERYLGSRLGQPYLDYCRQVRRWL